MFHSGDTPLLPFLTCQPVELSATAAKVGRTTVGCLGRKICQENPDFCIVNNNDSTRAKIRMYILGKRAAAPGHLSRANSPGVAASARSCGKFAERTCTRLSNSLPLHAISYPPSEIERTRDNVAKLFRVVK